MSNVPTTFAFSLPRLRYGFFRTFIDTQLVFAFVSFRLLLLFLLVIFSLIAFSRLTASG